MDQERKASDILLELEAKIDALLGLVRIQDLNIKILSNKINELYNQKNENKKPTIEAISSFPNYNPHKEEIKINSDFNIEMDNSPQGFRRTSRPETFAPEKDQKIQEQIKLPKAEIIVPKQEQLASYENSSVLQKVTDNNGKAIFMATVEITNTDKNITVAKTKTNAAGKWNASLPVGSYKVRIFKGESSTKSKIDLVQDLVIDGRENNLTLKDLKIK